MKITPSLAHSFSIVAKEIRKIYAHNYKLKESEVCLIVQGQLTHVLIKGKPFEKIETQQLHTLRYKPDGESNEV